ncbi:MAG: carbohydrate ABC transporter permease [Clostridiales bacterium]|jgi:putative aldouronate transport system permease protein|nr:carbohydrate ABC transporter permease [Clostridiales bacterium]
MKKTKLPISQRIFNACNVALLTVVSVLTLYPMWHVIMASFSHSLPLARHFGPIFYPLGGFTLESYKGVAANPVIPGGYRNTLFIVIFGVAVNILMTSFAAYFVTRKDQIISKFVMRFILFTMFFSGGMIPMYLNIRDLGLYNTIWALILPVSINTFNFVILRTSFYGIPESLEESALIDGANHLTILFRIYMPLSKAVLAVLVLYYGVGHWNSWFNAMLYIQSRDLFPLQLILREILISNDISAMASGGSQDLTEIAMSIRYTVIVIATVPILALYPFLQKYFASGVMVGAVKG